MLAMECEQIIYGIIFIILLNISVCIFSAWDLLRLKNTDASSVMSD